MIATLRTVLDSLYPYEDGSICGILSYQDEVEETAFIKTVKKYHGKSIFYDRSRR
jgi:hypothetical protein